MGCEVGFEENGMPTRNCPECGSDSIVYYDTDIVGATSGAIDLCWECESCGAMGRDEFSMVLDARVVNTAAADGELGEMEVRWSRQ